MAQISSNKCDICTEREGTALCYECQQYLCGACRAWHDKFPISKLHTVVDCGQVNKSFSATQLSCEKHNRNFIHYCQKCKCLTCVICATTHHKSHPFTDVSEVSSQARTDIEEHIVELKTKVEQVNDLSECIRSGEFKRDEEEKEKFTNEVKETLDAFNNITSSVADMYITRATDELVLRKLYFEHFLDKTDKLSELYQMTCTKLQHALAETHDVAFYVQYNELNREYQVLDDIPELKEPKAIGGFKLEEFTASVIDKLQENYNFSYVSLIKTKDEEIQNLTTKLNNEREEARSLLKSKDVEIKSLLKDIKTHYRELPVLQKKRQNREIQVFVNKVREDKRFVIAVQTRDKIREVKESIIEKEKINEQIMLFLSGTGKQLRDEFIIEDYEINNGSSLDLRLEPTQRNKKTKKKDSD